MFTDETLGMRNRQRASSERVVLHIDDGGPAVRERQGRKVAACASERRSGWRLQMRIEERRDARARGGRRFSIVSGVNALARR